MSTNIDENLPTRYMRIAGVLYLVIIVCGIFGEVGVRSSLVIQGDAAATAVNILDSDRLFRWGFLADSLMLLSDVALAVLLYVLLKPVSKVLSMTAAVFRLTQAAVIGSSLLNYYAAMLLLSGSSYSTVFATEQLNALAYIFLEIHSHGYDVGLLFFGVSSLIVGLLVVRSRAIPKFIGYGLMAAGVVYLAGSFTRFLSPGYLPIVAPAYVVPFIAELIFCLWLLLRGPRLKRV